MNADDFEVAMVMDKQGWNFVRTDGQWMVFTKVMQGTTYTARVGCDR